ncbi:NPCBM/NEW2 domain-containing protein [Rubripirellula reticaptiva]|uniref:NPCBM/NEW2 domain-containing protein n=1 Tax=Rubripirellula reticaptiva TaxID=2528013 RepID=UPI0011B64F77|nr:NPCBM/NEW2 domain-containing protein [Rubripirellula reticaptiva]
MTPRYLVIPKAIAACTVLLLAHALTANVVTAGNAMTVTTQSGESFGGDFAGIGDDSMLIIVDGAERAIPFSELQSLTPDDVASETGPAFRVTLVDGSRIAAQDISLDESGVVIEPRRQRTIRADLRKVKAIRFRASATTTDAQWLGLLEKESRGDVMVIRRPGDKLDPTSGIVEAIADAKVTFNLDGDTVAAPMDKLEGVIFGSTASVSDDAEIRIVDVYGSQWSVQSLSPSEPGQPLKLTLSSGLQHELPLGQIASMKLSSGMMMLATEKPAAASMTTYIETNVDAGLIDAFLGPAASGDADLAINGGGKIEYRVAEGFETISGTVVRSNKTKIASGVTVRVTLDGKTVWEESLTDTEPRGFEIPIASARRVAIEVDCQDDGDLGDMVTILRPRLLK